MDDQEMLSQLRDTVGKIADENIVFSKQLQSLLLPKDGKEFVEARKKSWECLHNIVNLLNTLNSIGE